MLIDVLADNQGSDTRRGAGLVLINLIGQWGPILGTQLYPTNQAPRFVEGMSVCAAFMFFTALLALLLSGLLSWRNRKLDERFGVLSEEQVNEGVGWAVENYGPNFRYIL